MYRNLAFYSVLFPYVSPLPVASSLQPVFFILLLPLAVVKLMNGKKIEIVTLLSICFGLYCLLFLFSGTASFDFLSIKKLFGVILVPVLALMVRDIFNWLNLWKLTFVALIYASTSILQTIFGLSFGNLTEQILHRNGTDYITRGANSLTTEPSFAGYIVCALFLVYLLKRKKGSLKKVDILFILAIAVTSLLSRSATGIFSFMVVLLPLLLSYLYTRITVKRILLLIGLIILGIYAVNSTPRVFQIIKILYDVGWQIILIDTSFGVRILQPYFGLVSAFQTPFGNGIGTATEVYGEMFSSLAKEVSLSSYFFERGKFEMTRSISVIGQYCVDVGALTLVYFGVLLYLVKGDLKWPRRIFILIALLQAHSYAYPFIWLFLMWKPQYENNSYN